eukprot:396982-Prymnesium_polylepis.1
MPGEEWARHAGPGCMANESKKAPNGELAYRAFDTEELQVYCTIRLKRDVRPGEEILWNYRSETPHRGGEEATAPRGGGSEGASAGAGAALQADAEAEEAGASAVTDRGVTPLRMDKKLAVTLLDALLTARQAAEGHENTLRFSGCGTRGAALRFHG